MRNRDSGGAATNMKREARRDGTGQVNEGCMQGAGAGTCARGGGRGKEGRDGAGWVNGGGVSAHERVGKERAHERSEAQTT